MPRHKPVLTKKDFVTRYKKQEFGNSSPTWDSYGEWLSDNGQRFGDLFHIRNRIAGGETWYDVRIFDLEFQWIVACHAVREQNLYISAMCPTEKTILQGEVQRGLWGLDLHYTTVAKPMREALKESPHDLTGCLVKVVLQKYLDQRSYDWLLYLLDEYPDHVVEFTTLATEWGTVPGYNTIFWECRLY